MAVCIIWTKCKDKDGYRVIKRDRKTMHAHRYFYKQKYGDIAEGLTLDTPIY